VDWAARYEVLRQQTLDCGQATAGWGLALLIHRGVAAWMRACSAMPVESSLARRTATIPSSLANEPAQHSPTVVPEVACRAAQILAQMVLETHRSL
jgi:hypothetical protein